MLYATFHEEILVHVVVTKELLALVDVIFVKEILIHVFRLTKFSCVLVSQRHFGACYFINNLLVHVNFPSDILVYAILLTTF